ncbi:MAG: right-handed parallel beta-helix repeat-containing protein [Armatimonadetes bacterium]|nr:right-handed parallel beta-helix repeat-containing protein [Armatimonadota bacterium]MDE2206203.1 right-handed parallel beta-helix repeat-containing protein [Armatimonadota bacterium]
MRTQTSSKFRALRSGLPSPTLVILLAVAAVNAAFAGPAKPRPITLYAAPEGSDLLNGRLPHRDGAGGGPLRSLDGARRAVRKLRARYPGATIHVLFASGTYRMLHAVTFTGADGASTGAATVFEAAPGARPIFSGGMRIGGWRRKADGTWSAAAPKVDGEALPFEQLWLNGRRLQPARLPAHGYLWVTGAVSAQGSQVVPPDAALRAPSTISSAAFQAEPRVARALAALSAAQLARVVVVVYHSWETSRHHIAGVDAATGIIRLTGHAPWPFLSFSTTQRYALENMPGEMNAGEWLYRPNGSIVIRPPSGASMSTADVEAPISTQFIVIAGTPFDPVRHITFRGLSFQYGQYLLPYAGHADPQAEVSIPAGIQADFATGITLERCAVSHIGIYGVWFREGCTACRVQHCTFEDLGAGGVRIGEPTIRGQAVDRTGRNTVADCSIRGWGRIHTGAIGIWIGQSASNTLTHNLLFSGFYTGISVGWTWGYGPSLALGNRITYNRIRRIGQGVLSDMGGIYLLGTETGALISHNFISDVQGFNHYGRGAWGIYNDEGVVGVTEQDNLVTNTGTGGLHQHYGANNLIVNNIFAFSATGQLQRSLAESHRSFTLEHNIVIWNGSGPLLYGNWHDGAYTADHNLYWNTGQRAVLFEGHTLAQWQALGHEAGSIVADPLFVNASAGDFDLRAGSPAPAIGFVPFDWRAAGVRPAKRRKILN